MLEGFYAQIHSLTLSVQIFRIVMLFSTINKYNDTLYDEGNSSFIDSLVFPISLDYFLNFLLYFLLGNFGQSIGNITYQIINLLWYMELILLIQWMV